MDGTPRGDANAIAHTSGRYADAQSSGQYAPDSSHHSLVADTWNWTEKNVVAPFVNSVAIEPFNATVVNVANLVGQPFGKHFDALKKFDVNAHPTGAESTVNMISGGLGTAFVYAAAIKLTGSGLNRAAASLGEESAISGFSRNPLTAQIAGPTLYDGMRNPQNGESRIGNMIATGTAFGAFGLGGRLVSDMSAVPLFAARAGIGAAAMTSGRVLGDLYDGRTPTADELYKTALTGGIVNSVVPLMFGRSSRVSESSDLESQIGARKLASGEGETFQKSNRPPKVFGSTDGTYAILQSDGAAASFVNGKWQPGIDFLIRDFLDMATISKPDLYEKLLKEAAEALAKSMKE